jgi:hypothetical protein
VVGELQFEYYWKWVKGLSVYPNPTTGIVNISGVEIEGASVSIVDISGRIIKNAATAKGNTVQVNEKT